MTDSAAPTPESEAPTEEASLLTGAQESPADAEATPKEGEDAPKADGEDSPKDEPKDGQEATSEELDPFDFKIELPEGVQYDETREQGFKGAMSALEKAVFEAGGDRAKIREAIAKTAQGLVDTEVENVKALASASANEVAERRKEWASQAKADEEYGGGAFERNMAFVAKARDAFVSEELVEVLNSHGLGDHPEVIRHLYRIGKTISEDDPSGGGASAQPRKKSTEEILYGSKK